MQKISRSKEKTLKALKHRREIKESNSEWSLSLIHSAFDPKTRIMDFDTELKRH